MELVFLFIRIAILLWLFISYAINFTSQCYFHGLAELRTYKITDVIRSVVFELLIIFTFMVIVPLPIHIGWMWWRWGPEICALLYILVNHGKEITVKKDVVATVIISLFEVGSGALAGLYVPFVQIGNLIGIPGNYGYWLILVPLIIGFAIFAGVRKTQADNMFDPKKKKTEADKADVNITT